MGGKEQLYICACEKSVATVFGFHCSKKSKALLNMHACLLHVQSTMGQFCLIRGVKLAGWVLFFSPHPVQDQKKKMKDDSQCSLFQLL